MSSKITFILFILQRYDMTLKVGTACTWPSMASGELSASKETPPINSCSYGRLVRHCQSYDRNHQCMSQSHKQRYASCSVAWGRQTDDTEGMQAGTHTCTGFKLWRSGEGSSLSLFVVGHSPENRSYTWYLALAATRNDTNLYIYPHVCSHYITEMIIY